MRTRSPRCGLTPTFRVAYRFARTTTSSRTAFGRSIDASLCESNWLYGLHRKDDVALLPLTVVPLARGATKRFAEAIGRNGAQQKFPRVIQPHEHELLRVLEGLATR